MLCPASGRPLEQASRAPVAEKILSPVLSVGLVSFEYGRPGEPASPLASCESAIEYALEAERLGFSHVWVGGYAAGSQGSAADIVLACALLTDTSSIAVATSASDTNLMPTQQLTTEAHRLAVSTAGRFELGIAALTRDKTDVGSRRAQPGGGHLDDTLANWSTLLPHAVIWVQTDDACGVASAASAGAGIVLPTYLPRPVVRALSKTYHEKYAGSGVPTVAVQRDVCATSDDMEFARRRHEGEPGVCQQGPVNRVAHGSYAHIASVLLEDIDDGADHVIVRSAFGGRTNVETIQGLAREPQLKGLLTAGE